MYGVARRKGMGVVVRPDGSFYVPPECTWPILGGYLGLVSKSCAPPTKAEFLADQMSNLGGAAKANPALVADLTSTWSQTLIDQCKRNPTDCADYETALKYPTLSAAVGADAIQGGEAVGSAVGDAFRGISDAVKSAFDMNWGGLLLIGAVGIFGVMTLMQPGPRRYGR